MKSSKPQVTSESDTRGSLPGRDVKGLARAAVSAECKPCGIIWANPTALQCNIIRWLDLPLKNKDAGLSLVYSCTNRQDIWYFQLNKFLGPHYFGTIYHIFGSILIKHDSGCPILENYRRRLIWFDVVSLRLLGPLFLGLSTTIHLQKSTPTIRSYWLVLFHGVFAQNVFVE
jgi:hypothetical protein